MKALLTLLALLTSASISFAQAEIQTITCENLMKSMLDFQNHHQSTTAYIMDDYSGTVSTVSSWDNVLTPWEGRKVSVPYNYFSGMRSTVITLRENYRKTGNYLNAQQRFLNELMMVLPTCLK